MSRLSAFFIGLTLVLNTLAFGFDEVGEDALVIYKVKGTELRLLKRQGRRLPARLKLLKNDHVLHMEMWEDVQKLYPASYLTAIDRFVVFSDGAENILASVTPRAPLFEDWILAIDAEDGFDISEDYLRTLVHEFGHMLFLAPKAVPRAVSLLNDITNANLYDRLAAACESYFAQEGCATEQSVLNRFVEAYWDDKLANIDRMDEVARFRLYPTEFVSEYAATNPAEDLAEVWSVYVFGGDFSGIASKKIAMLDAIPEIRALRNGFRKTLEMNFADAVVLE